MKSGASKSDIDDKISKRITIIESLDSLIKESIYYRTHSDNFNSEKIAICSWHDSNKKTKIL